jgi:hypothetical protein
MEVQELVGYVGHDRGPAGRDAAFGGEDQEAGEKLADVEAGAELGEFGEEFGGEIFRVVLRRLGAASKAEWRKQRCDRVQNSETTAATVGGERESGVSRQGDEKMETEDAKEQLSRRGFLGVGSAALAAAVGAQRVIRQANRVILEALRLEHQFVR